MQTMTKLRWIEHISLYLNIVITLSMSYPYGTAYAVSDVTTKEAVSIEQKKEDEIEIFKTIADLKEELGIPTIEQDFRIKQEEYERKLEEERIRQEAERKQREIDEAEYIDKNDISKPSNMSVEAIYNLLEDTTYQTYDIAQLLYDAERADYPVNAIFMISLTRHESWHGKSELAMSRNNISSWRLSDGDWRYFETKYDCMKRTIKLISEEYVNPEGQFFYGTSLDGIGHYYCEGNLWAGYISEMIDYVREKY